MQQVRKEKNLKYVAFSLLQFKKNRKMLTLPPFHVFKNQNQKHQKKKLLASFYITTFILCFSVLFHPLCSRILGQITVLTALNRHFVTDPNVFQITFSPSKMFLITKRSMKKNLPQKLYNEKEIETSKKAYKYIQICCMTWS